METVEVPKLGAVSSVLVGGTSTDPVVRSPLRAWAAASTFTANVVAFVILPVKARVNVAVVSPEFTVDTFEMDKLGIVVTNSKLEAVTPLPKVVPVSVIPRVAELRFVPVNDTGLKEVIAAS